MIMNKTYINRVLNDRENREKSGNLVEREKSGKSTERNLICGQEKSCRPIFTHFLSWIHHKQRNRLLNL